MNFKFKTLSFDHPCAFKSGELRWALKILGIGSLEFIRM